MITKDYNAIPWKDLVYYDVSSSTFLRRSVETNYGVEKERRKKDSEIGHLTFKKDGTRHYASMKHKKKNYLIHRIIYILHRGYIPDGMVVNHIDFNTHNNDISNLEICTFRQNLNRTQVSKRLKLHHSNTSGILGVSEAVKFNGYKTYLYANAQWRDINGNTCFKQFPYDKHGKEMAWELATDYRKSMEGLNE